MVDPAGAPRHSAARAQQRAASSSGRTSSPRGTGSSSCANQRTSAISTGSARTRAGSASSACRHVRRTDMRSRRISRVVSSRQRRSPTPSSSSHLAFGGPQRRLAPTHAAAGDVPGRPLPVGVAHEQHLAAVGQHALHAAPAARDDERAQLQAEPRKAVEAPQDGDAQVAHGSDHGLAWTTGPLLQLPNPSGPPRAALSDILFKRAGRPVARRRRARRRARGCGARRRPSRSRERARRPPRRAGRAAARRSAGAQS